MHYDYKETLIKKLFEFISEQVNLLINDYLAFVAR